MITKTFKITLASKTKREMQKDIDYLERTFGAEEVTPSVWIGIDDFPHEDWECGNCGNLIFDTNKPCDDYKYCPVCGSLMQDKEVEDD